MSGFINRILNRKPALRYICLVAFVIIAATANSQSSGQNQILYSIFPTNDLTRVLTRTDAGFYWMGNSSGIYRFDGQSWKNFVIDDENSAYEHNQFVTSEMFTDRSGFHWFSTYRALHSYDPVAEQFDTYRIHRDDEEIARGYSVFHDDTIAGELLLTAGNSVYAFNKSTAKHRLLLDSIKSNSIGYLNENDTHKFYGAPWWNADGLEYFEYSAGGITNFRRLELPVMVKEIASYYNDSIFLCTPNGLQLLTNLFSPQSRKLEMLIPGESRHVTITPDRKTVYTSIESQGIYAYDPKTNQVTAKWDSISGLRGNDARYLTPDGQGNLFVSHLERGIDIITPENKQLRYLKYQGSASLSDIAVNSAGNWICVDEEGQLYEYKSSGGKTASWVPKTFSSDRYPTPRRSRIAIGDDGRIDIHGREYIAQLNASGEPEGFTKLPFSLYRGIISFQDGERIMVGSNGILSIRGNNAPLPLAGLPFGEDHYFSNIAKVNDDRFLACYREVALWDVVRSESGWRVQAKYPMPGEMQTALQIGPEVFVGTSAGLLAIKGDSLYTTFNPTSTNGNLWINALYKDTANCLWLGTEQGLFCYNPKTGNYQYYSKADGLKDDWFIRANVIANGDEFSMATKTGLVTVNTHLADDTISKNNIYFSDIWVNGIQKTDHSPYAPKPLKLDYQHNSVSFLPGMIELSSSALSGFRYKLEGLEEEYTYSKAGEVVRYPSIPSGDYTFRFVGVDKNGRTTVPTTLSVTISPPFYKTWWFWILCGTAVLSLFYYLSRRAVQIEKARQEAIRKEDARKAAETLKRHQAVVREQRRIMMELHDDLGGTLGSLFYTLDGYLLDQVSGLPVTPDFELLKNTSGDAMKQLREVMKNNVAREMSLPVFMRTLAEQARAVAANSRLDWELEKEGNFPGLQLSSQQVHNALLVFKEALQNVRKHAKATSFILKFQLEEEPDNILAITLADNGVGLGDVSTDHREDGTGHGFRNMQRRAEDLEGTLTISSPQDGGTCLRLSFPLG